MNIEEEIKNITNYINKVESNIELENTELSNQKELLRLKELVQTEIDTNNKKIISINNTINNYSTEKKKILKKEESIYNNELRRLVEKRILLKDINNLQLNECIKEGVSIYMKKRELLQQIDYTNNKIAEFNTRKKQIRAEYVKNVKAKNAVIKQQKNGNSDINEVKDTISNLTNEINSYPNKRNNVLKSEILDSNEKLSQLEQLEQEQVKIIAKRNKLIKYLTQYKPQPLTNKTYFLKNKLPQDYKEYKNKLVVLNDKLKLCNKEINNHKLKLEELEYKITEEYITSTLLKENKRCELRWNKMNERINNTIDEYKLSFSSEIENLQNCNNQLYHKLELIRNKLLGININSEKEAEINNNNELLSTIKNRLNYLKIKKNNLN